MTLTEVYVNFHTLPETCIIFCKRRLVYLAFSFGHEPSRNRMAGCGLHSADLGQKQVAGCFELCIEPLGMEKEGDFLTS